MGMPIRRNEEWVQIAELDEDDQVRFTTAFRELMKDLDWEAKAFVGHLLGLWYDPFEHMLDYTSGEARHSEDQPGQFDRNGLDEPQDHQPPHEAGAGLELNTDHPNNHPSRTLRQRQALTPATKF
jgi:hypothetical protein